MRPRVGLRPTTPQNAAGMRADPPPSVPMWSGPINAAVPAAISRSAARAAARASSTGTSVVKAFSRASATAIRASTASRSSTGESARRWIRSAASASERRTSVASGTARSLSRPTRTHTALARAGGARQYGIVAERGFILAPTYRVVGGRPEVHLYGVLEGGEPVLVVDDRQAPYF